MAWNRVLVLLPLLLHTSTGLLATPSSAYSRLDLSIGPGRALHRLGKLPSVGKEDVAGGGRRVSSLRGGAGEDLVIGIDGGTESIRASVFRADGSVLGNCAAPYATTFSQPGWAEQEPEEWWACLGIAVRGAVRAAAAAEGVGEEELGARVKALCADTTCCTVVALGQDQKALRPALLWMDSRSAPQAAKILQLASQGPEDAGVKRSLAVNSGGKGPLSAEWMLPKSLWLKENDREVWDKAETVCEYQDYINLRLTGKLVASSCNVAARWHWNGEEAIVPSNAPPSLSAPRGRPVALLHRLGLDDLLDKWPAECVAMGTTISPLSPSAALHLGLPASVLVAQGGPDAFVGMLGLGCTRPGQLALITGSSHLHLAVSATPATAEGIWGAYAGAPLPGLCFAEGGQSSTGSILRWARNLFTGGAEDGVTYAQLDQEAADVDVGSDGLVALETFQGSRTPITDPLAKGALVGLSLSHTRAHVWRALLEAVCFGTRACVDALRQAGHGADEILVAGGATRSPFWLQMHADATGLPVAVCACPDGPLLGSAILAAAAAGLHGGDVLAAVKAMVRVEKRIQPNPEAVLKYTAVFQHTYSRLAAAVQPIAHAAARLLGGDVVSPEAGLSGKTEAGLSDKTEEGPSAKTAQEKKEEADDEVTRKLAEVSLGEGVAVCPSLLGCDWADIAGAVKACEKAGAEMLHLDMFDGVAIPSPNALTFGPQMIAAIRKRTSLLLDVHLVAQNPSRYIEPLAAAGADRLTFQWESVPSTAKATALARAIRDSGMRAGVCLAPETHVDAILGLVDEGLVDLINILTVKPGFGGQALQSAMLDKVRALSKIKNRLEKAGVEVIQVDGGVTGSTAKACIDAGATALVSGSWLFAHKGGVAAAVKELRAAA